MAGSFMELDRKARGALAAVLTVMVIILPAATSPALARGPDAIADIAESVIDAVVNVSTSQTVDAKPGAMPQLPPGS